MKKLAFGSLYLCLSLSSYSQQAHSLTVGPFLSDPIGFHDQSPDLSWKLPEEFTAQSAYKIEARTDGTDLNTGWIESNQSLFIPFPFAPLESRQSFNWRVKVKDQDGTESEWSEEASLEIGLLSKKDWHAHWIHPHQEIDLHSEPVAYLRRAFKLNKAIREARLYATARGVFKLKLNNKRVGQDHFANGWTPYDQRIDTLTYDVTDLLQQGENLIQAALGTGWYAGRLPFETQVRGPYGVVPELLLQLEIEYSDDSTTTIISDGDWQGTYQGPIKSSSFYDGEIYDAERATGDWENVQSVSNLGAAMLKPKPFEPIRKESLRSPISITELDPGKFSFDLGQNMVGWARIKVPAEKGKTITLRFAELLQKDGNLYTENYRTAKSTDSITPASDGIMEWEPSFTFHGFRYVEISGLPNGSAPQSDWVTGVVLQSSMDLKGDFESSNPKLNQLQSNILWGWKGNSLDIPTDCPQRDERAGWTGDAQVFAPTSLFLTHSLAFWKSWLESMRLEQDSTGVIPDIIPTARKKWRNRAPGWMDAATIIPWESYLRTGDLSVLKDNYKMMKRLVSWYQNQASADGMLTDLRKGYGDWLQPFQITPPDPKDRESDRKGDTDLNYLGNAFYTRSSQILANTANILGLEDEALQLSIEADSLKRSFQELYFASDGSLKLPVETQTAYALAISFDLLPEDLQKKAGNHLARLVLEADGHLRTGFLGTPHLIPALDKIGHSELAYSILIKETYPSWFYSINQGATTMWERWNSYSHEDGFGDAGMNSFNHYAYGAIGQWMYERLAGLSPDPEHPGYKHFFIRPLTSVPLDSAAAELETPYGKASSSWQKRADGSIILEVTVPPNSAATIIEPNDNKIELQAGYHTLRLLPTPKS
ncbi:alpha-L-rhamnosidase [Pelagicoccus albus]|uniref:alpha-L-rhamnosidase n=1 Tax=Pelagicoccus albus TaxID=415222 RepID=A0A7X1E9U0_9BACT|nr:alpha-L-rhamnosidase [Pelagicoccus albus]MBC2606112.1 family 78 glycoside hydrolase catalytic domain [Pelagicoccus albus]